jgi:hypothetical protein
MKALSDVLELAQRNGVGIGHFNIADLLGGAIDDTGRQLAPEAV